MYLIDYCGSHWSAVNMSALNHFKKPNSLQLTASLQNVLGCSWLAYTHLKNTWWSTHGMHITCISGHIMARTKQFSTLWKFFFWLGGFVLMHNVIVYSCTLKLNTDIQQDTSTCMYDLVITWACTSNIWLWRQTKWAQQRTWSQCWQGREGGREGVQLHACTVYGSVVHTAVHVDVLICHEHTWTCWLSSV